MKLFLFFTLSTFVFANDMTLRGDGRLTSPGTVTFEAENRGGPKDSLSVIGIILGKHRKSGATTVLKSTLAQAVIPADLTVFRLNINDEEWVTWTREHEPITVGITFEKPEDGQRWQYENLLKAEDAAKQPPGEFKTKGYFRPRRH